MLLLTDEQLLKTEVIEMRRINFVDVFFIKVIKNFVSAML
jgi:hypothetical protein